MRCSNPLKLTFSGGNHPHYQLSFFFVLIFVSLFLLLLTGLYCELLAADKMKVLPAEKKEVLTYMKEHEDTMFPHSFSFSNSDGKQPEDRELFGDILSLLDELNLKSEDDDEPVPSDEKDDPQSTDAKRPNGSETPSDSSGDNGHPSNVVADSAVEVHDKV